MVGGKISGAQLIHPLHYRTELFLNHADTVVGNLSMCNRPIQCFRVQYLPKLVHIVHRVDGLMLGQIIGGEALRCGGHRQLAFVGYLVGLQKGSQILAFGDACQVVCFVTHQHIKTEVVQFSGRFNQFVCRVVRRDDDHGFFASCSLAFVLTKMPYSGNVCRNARWVNAGAVVVIGVRVCTPNEQ